MIKIVRSEANEFIENVGTKKPQKNINLKNNERQFTYDEKHTRDREVAICAMDFAFIEPSWLAVADTKARVQIWDISQALEFIGFRNDIVSMNRDYHFPQPPSFNNTNEIHKVMSLFFFLYFIFIYVCFFMMACMCMCVQCTVHSAQYMCVRVLLFFFYVFSLII